MAATILVKEVLYKACVLLQDVAPQFTRWSERELVSWLNDAQLAIVKFLPSACSRVDAIKLKPGTRQSIESIAAVDCKPGDGSVPGAPILGIQVLSFIRNMGADGLTPGAPIRIIGREILDSQSPDWHTVTGSVVRNVVYDPLTPRYFYVRPAVPAGGRWIEIGWNAQPIAIANNGTEGAELYRFDGASTTKISLADEFNDDLVNYVVARGFLKNAQAIGNDGKAAQFVGLFTSSLNAKVTALTGHNPNLQRLPMMTEPIGGAQ